MHGALFLSHFHSSGKVTLAEVRNLVRHHRGKFILSNGVLKETAVYPDHAARHGEGVDRWIVDDYQLDAAILKLAVLRQFEHEVFEVAVQ